MSNPGVTAVIAGSRGCCGAESTGGCGGMQITGIILRVYCLGGNKGMKTVEFIACNYANKNAI